MNRAVLCSCLAAVLAGIASPARADQRPLVKVRFASEPRAVTAGVTYPGAFEIVAIEGGEVTNLHLEGEGWSQFQLTPPDPVHLTPDQVHRVQFAAVAGDPNQPLWVVFLYDGREVRRRFDLSPAAIAALGHSEATAQVAAAGATPGTLDIELDDGVKLDLGGLQPVGARPRLPGDKPRTETPPERSAGGHWVTVTGRFVFMDSFNAWVGAHGMTVRIYDEEWDSDTFLGYTITDWNGFWSATVWSEEGAPDIYMEFEAANSAVELEDDSVLEENWVWTSGVHEDFGGSFLNHGTSASANPGLHPVLFILNNMTRTWLWLNSYGYNTPSVDCQYPESGSDVSFYDGEVHVIPERRWTSGTHIHEYGHHWVKTYALTQVPSYCNQTCDPDFPDNCGHCAWCQENPNDAWNEGFPNWLADVVGRHIESAYGATLSGKRTFEVTGPCTGTGNMPCPCLPTATEGFVSALLRDIEDGGTPDTDANALSGGTDAFAIGSDEILWVTKTFDPATVVDFLNDFKATYPGNCEQLWRTARNNGYSVGDNTAPGIVVNLETLSHVVGLQDSSADNTIDYAWDRAPDDCSGTAGYAISLTLNFPAMPSQTLSIGNATVFTTGHLAPGSYHFNIRARDRSGKWSNNYAHLGPIVIRAPHPADLALEERAGWDFPVVPRANAAATVTSVPAPTTLNGDVLGTWYNWNLVNHGELMSATPYFKVQLRLDGVPYDTYNAEEWLPPGQQFAENNLGPVLVRGGRHTFEVFAESAEAWAEPVETDNHWAKQWAWTPPAMSSVAPPVVRFAPPARTGGWNWIFNPDPFDPGTGPWDNCDGLRIPDLRYLEGDAWRAVWAHAQDPTENYNVDLHGVAAFNYVENGFNQPLHRSQRPAGRLDAAIVNDFRLNTHVWDVGVVNPSGGTSQYVADYERSSVIAVPDSIGVTLGQDQMVRIFHFWLPPLTGGPTKVTIVSDSIPGLHVAWFDASTFTAVLADADAEVVTGIDGMAQLVFSAGGVPDPHGLVIYRDPTSGTGPISFGLKIRSSLHAYVVAPAPGWDAPMVPRPFDDATPDLVPRPSVLYGDQPATYLNLSFLNQSDTPGEDVVAAACVDDSCIAQYVYPSPPPDAYVLGIEGVPVTVPGGRHVLALVVDPDDRIEEVSETDNAYAEQYVWSPTPIAFANPVVRPLPGDPYSGWSRVPPSDEPMWLNLDGLRTPPYDGIRGTEPLWGGVAVMPDAGFDADVRLFEMSAGAKDGFDSTLAHSAWGVGLSEFVLVNFAATPRRTFDFGVLNAGAGGGADGTEGGSYTGEAIRSQYLGSAPDGTYGPYEMFPGHMLHLYAMDLTPARYRILVEHLTGGVDWGASLYSPDHAFTSKGYYHPLSAAWAAGPGASEEFEADIVEPGPYCLAVWKRGSADLPLESGYQLRIVRDATAVLDPGLVSRTGLAAVYPHPVSAGASIAFDLAEGGDAQLEVYDLRGARVRTLASGPHVAGRHSVHWNGTADDGRRIASGIYLLRLSAAGVTDARKVVVMH